jgi:hypothetical protein
MPPDVPSPNPHLHRRLTPPPPCTPFSIFCSQAPSTAATPAAMHTPSRVLPLAFRWMSTALGLPNPSHRHATAVARLVTSAENATHIMMSAT